MSLNKEQQLAASIAAKGKHLCIVGAGGVGKSFMINHLSTQEDFRTIVTATTGTAAVNIGGMTFHSAFSVPIGYHTPEDLKKVYRKTTSVFKGDCVDRIIIDESSMITPSGWYVFTERLKKWDKRRARKKLPPIQVIVVMDLMQLPAIIRDRELELTMKEFGTSKFYKTKQFKDMDFEVVQLTQSMRQSDGEFKSILDKLRFGEDVGQVVDWLNTNCYRYPLPKDCTILATTNKAVDSYNRTVYNNNTNDAGCYTATIAGNFKAKDAPVPEALYLKLGLRVMTVKNAKTEGDEEPEYINGSTGVITMFTEEGPWVKLDHSGEEVVVNSSVWESFSYEVDKDTGDLRKFVEGSFEQVPLRQCSSISVHKSQGAEFHKYIIDPSWGMGWSNALAYVACSRATKPEAIYLKRKLKVEDVAVDYEAVEWLEQNTL